MTAGAGGRPAGRRTAGEVGGAAEEAEPRTTPFVNQQMQKGSRLLTYINARLRVTIQQE